MKKLGSYLKQNLNEYLVTDINSNPNDLGGLNDEDYDYGPGCIDIHGVMVKHNILKYGLGKFCEFENFYFEEGWTGREEVPCLADRTHNRNVAAAVATRISRYYSSFEEMIDKGVEIAEEPRIYELFVKLAGIMYPKEKIWYGDSSNNDAFWKESDKLSKRRHKFKE